MPETLCYNCAHTIFKQPGEEEWFHSNRLKDGSCYHQDKEGICGCRNASFEQLPGMPGPKAEPKRSFVEKVVEKVKPPVQPERVVHTNVLPPENPTPSQTIVSPKVEDKDPPKEDPVNTVLLYLLEDKHYTAQECLWILEESKHHLMNWAFKKE